MQITVSGKKIEVGESLREYITNNLEKSVTKYFERAIHGGVVLSKEGSKFVADIHINEGTKTGISIKSKGDADGAHAAFDIAVDRVAKQLRRYKRRITGHRHGESNKILTATKYTLLSDNEAAEEEITHDDSPVIIAETPEFIETIGVNDAVMRLELGSLNALMFVNKKNNNINVIYKRDDGNIVWVDPKNNSGQIAS
jgi:ribosomal subunit interface protein